MSQFSWAMACCLHSQHCCWEMQDAATASHASWHERAAVRSAEAPVTRKGGAGHGRMLLVDIRDAGVAGCRIMMLVGVEGRGPVFGPGRFFH